MIKKIPINKVKIGMYVHDLDCSWIQHPFTVNQFKLVKQAQIEQIKKAGIQEFYIDTEKGIDIEEIAVVDEMMDHDSSELLSQNVAKESNKKALADELLSANKVKREATQAISNIMENARLGKLIDLDHIEPVVENVVFSALSNKDALIGLTRIRKLDKYTFEHAVGSSILLVAFGESIALNKDELIQMGIGGLLMDIGKSLAPQKILTKPGKLTDKEFAIMREHVSNSMDILEKMTGVSDIVMSIANEHHERYDGSGYPAGKQGEGISLYGQMAAIVDVYDALTVDRVYCSGISPNAALKKLVALGKQFNQELVQQFIHCVGIYPIGSLIALSNGRFAVVIDRGDKGLLYPVVRVIFDSTKRQFMTPQDVDLSDQRGKEIVKIVGAVEPGKWRINPADFMEHARYS